jgi:branched-chain amino acid transport system ATP-binding protein
VSVLLEARNLSAGYAGQPVVRDVDLEVNEGEVVCLLGPNGAGKTTTLLTLSGELPPVSGQVLLNGERTKAPLFRRARRGLGFVTEERSVFKGLSCRDNLRCGGGSVDAALELFPELEKRLDVKGGLLSGGEQQMLSLARALSREPTVFLADELSLGLAPMVVDRLLTAVRTAANDRGVGALVVEQHARKALRYADRMYLMNRGRIQLSLPAAEAIERIDEIEEAYLHAEHEHDEMSMEQPEEPTNG